MTNTIVAFCMRRFRDGAEPETVWREAQDRFPFLSVSWHYVKGLHRVAMAAKQGERHE